MKHVLIFMYRFTVLSLLLILWLLPYYIWNAKKHSDHQDVLYEFSDSFREFRGHFVKGRYEL